MIEVIGVAIFLVVITIVLRVLFTWRLRRVAARICSLAPLLAPEDTNLMYARAWHRLAWRQSCREAWNLLASASGHEYLNKAEERLAKIERSHGIAAPSTW